MAMNNEMLSHEALKQALLDSLVGNEHFRLISEYLDQTLTGAATVSDKEGDSPVDRWLSWVKKQSLLKVVNCDVPIGILPDGLMGQLKDVRVFSKGAPDDKIYENNKCIREKVARGNTILHIDSGPNAGNRCLIYGLKKFTGGLGDDDDKEKGDNHTWKKYFSKPLEEADTVIATRKANGEAGHFSCVHLNGQFLICGGSKNVHMLIRDRKDINLYSGDRFAVAKEVCEAIMDVLENLEESQRIRLLSFLCHTGYTAIFEILNPNHQHVEDLSYLEKPQLCFITWAQCDLEPASGSSLCCVPPHVAIETAKALGLSAVMYDAIPMSDVDGRMRQIRQGYNYEGEVLYFLDKSSSVMGLLKKKTIWYIICRAIREKVKVACRLSASKPETFVLSKALDKIKKRLNEIQTWLGLDDDSLAQWTELGCKFLRWCLENVEQGQVTLSEVADMFPVLWTRYLTETDQTDKIAVQWNEPEGSDD